MSRKIFIIGDIDAEMHLKLTRRMAYLEDKSDEPINVVLSSDGGYATVALAMYDRIKESPCEVTVTATGLVASAAVLVLVAGAKGRMTESAWVMVHDDTAPVAKNARVSQAVRTVEHGRRMERQWNFLLEQNTGTDRKIWDTLHQNETWLTAKQCLKLGLIKEIV